MFELVAALVALASAVAAFALWMYALWTEQYALGFWIAFLAVVPVAWVGAIVLSYVDLFLDGVWEFLVWNYRRLRGRRRVSRPPLGVSRLQTCPSCGGEFFIDSVGGYDGCDLCAFGANALSADVSRFRIGRDSSMERFS